MGDGAAGGKTPVNQQFLAGEIHRSASSGQLASGS
jgi:hypothetical protein